MTRLPAKQVDSSAREATPFICIPLLSPDWKPANPPFTLIFFVPTAP